MHPRRPVSPQLVELALLQSGVVTREQAIAYGLAPASLRRLVQEGGWQRLAVGVYAISPLPVSWTARAWAGVLIGGDQARIGGLAAAHLHGLAERPPDRIDVLVPPTGRPRVGGPWRFVREEAGCRGSRSVGSPPRLRVEDTVLDLVAAAKDEREVVNWVTAALQNRLTTAHQLQRALMRRRRMPHRDVLESVIGDGQAGARSPLEVRYLRDVERAHGLPTAARQIRRRRSECDVWYEEYRLLVELDGRRGHDGTGVFRDMRRDNAATTDGLWTLRYGYRDVLGSPCEVAAQVAQNLLDRGWPGPFERCNRCRRAA
jgi:very-short-patch-repair endonuclease